MNGDLFDSFPRDLCSIILHWLTPEDFICQGRGPIGIGL